MDFQNLNGVYKLKRFCRFCIEFVINFLSFIFSLNFSIILIFRSTKPTLKASFSKFCLLEIIV